MRCEVTFHSQIQSLERVRTKKEREIAAAGIRTISVGQYYLDFWASPHNKRQHQHHSNGSHFPSCGLRTDLSLWETAEAHSRRQHLIQPSSPHYDGNASMHPTSTIQRAHHAAWLRNPFLQPLPEFATLVRGASFVASDCHSELMPGQFNRQDYVIALNRTGFRVDGLGKCLHSPPNPEGIVMGTAHGGDKKPTLARYMFVLAYENSIEPGYVTEKPFDGLYAGIVPVYLGDASTLRALLPHPLAAIFVEDYPDAAALGKYLTYLAQNETAYELHRAWHRDFDQAKHIANTPRLHNTLICQVCAWAVRANASVPVPQRAALRNGCVL